MEVAETAIKLIEEKLEKLKEFLAIAFVAEEKDALKKQIEFFEGILESLELAKKEVNNDETEARYIDAAVKYANQIGFIVYRKTATEFKDLPTPEQTAAKVNKFNDARQKRVDEINKQHQEIFEEQKALDVFTGIIAGLSKEEAKKRMAEHEAKIREAAKNQ